MARLWRTTTFRLALLYLGLFVASVIVILWVVYRSTAGFIEHQLTEDISDDIVALQERFKTFGPPGLIDAVQQHAREPHTNSIYLLMGPGGERLAGNLSGWPTAPPDREGWIHFQVAATGRPTGGGATARAVVFALPGGLRLLVGRDMSELDSLRDQIARSLGWIFVVTVGLGVAGGMLLGRGMLHRIELINRTTHQIMTGDLSGRVPRPGSGDEIDQLAGNLNSMLDQIEHLMTGMRQVTESIAHDLRTPLTRLRSRIELVLIKDTDDAEIYRNALQETIAEADWLLATFKALLSIAQAEAGSQRAAFRSVDLAEVARMVADLYEPVADDKGQTFTIRIDGAPRVRGNAQLLSQAIANLLDNAVKYTPPGGAVTLRVEGAGPDQAGSITVSDNGPGIAPEQRERVLERFVRLDDARNSPGNGLGLSLVDAVARLHEAKLVLDDNHPGLSVGIILPPEAAAAATEAEDAPASARAG